MWNWFNCYLSGRHEFGVWCEPGTIFLRCVHCGKRSPGWAVDAAMRRPPRRPETKAVSAQAAGRRVLPFSRAAAR